MITEISRQEALAAFAERHPGLPLQEVQGILDQWLECGCVDFRCDEDGQWHVRLCSPRRKH